MKLRPKTTISEHFSAIKDPRIDRTKRHKLIDIITITLCAVISGAETWEDIELFGNCKHEWFSSFLELTNAIPSHDTFNRVFARLDPQELEKCFGSWVESISGLLPGEQIAIDGKTLRNSFTNDGEQKAIVMVSAWAGLFHSRWYCNYGTHCSPSSFAKTTARRTNLQARLQSHH